MSSLTAFAIVTLDGSGKPVPGVIAFLQALALGPNTISIPTNSPDGYAVLNNVPFPFSGTITIAGNAQYATYPLSVTQPNTTVRFGGTQVNPQDILLPAVVPNFNKPFQVMNPVWKGNDCGIHLSYLPPIEGGSSNASLFVGWMYTRYAPDIRSRIRTDYSQLFTSIALSWIDAFDAGDSPEVFLSKCLEWHGTGVDVCVFLGAKDSGMDHNVQALIDFAMPFLNIAVGKIPAFVVPGWEESLWLDTDEIIAALQALAPICLAKPGTLVYIHEQEGYMGFPKPGADLASFWWPLQGLCHGILLQRRLNTDDTNFISWLQDCLQRLDGGWNMPPSNGIDGRKLMGVAYELNYQDQFNDGASTESGNHLGDIAIVQSYGSSKIMGTGNGLTQ